MTKSLDKKEKERKKGRPQKEEERNIKEEKVQMGILPDDVDFRRGMGCG
jgi:hypothetical protein